jgi:hypothetical protein
MFTIFAWELATEWDPGSGRAGVAGAVRSLAAESAQADFAFSQRRVHSFP